jgi:hypothetical protein
MSIHIVFNLHACYCKKRNFISKLIDGDRVVTSHEHKHEVLYGFYSNLLDIARQHEFTLDLEACHRFEVNLGALDLPISKEEIRATIASLP